MASSGGVADVTVFRICLWPLHGATSKYEGVVTHVRECERSSGQVRNLFTDTFVTRCYKASPLTVKGISDDKSDVAAVEVMRGLWGL